MVHVLAVPVEPENDIALEVSADFHRVHRGAGDLTGFKVPVDLLGRVKHLDRRHSKLLIGLLCETGTGNPDILTGQFLGQLFKTPVATAGTALANEGAVIQKQAEGMLVLAVGTTVAQGAERGDQLFVLSAGAKLIFAEVLVCEFYNLFPCRFIKQTNHSFSASATGW